MKHLFKITAICLLFTFILTGCGSSPAGSQGTPAIVHTEESPAAEPVESAAPESSPSVTVEAAPESSPSETAPEKPSGLFGVTWEIWDYQFCSVSAMSREEAEGYRGYTLSYSEDGVMQNGTDLALGDLSYEYGEPLTEDDVLEGYKANLGEWWSGIGQVSPVTVNSDGYFLGQYVFLVSDEVIWIYSEGCFFLARNESQN